jgi:hypothetical protein
VLGFRGRQVSKQPTDIRIRGPRRRMLVEPGRVLLHLLGLLSYRLDALQADLPEFLAVNEPADVSPPDQRNMFAELGSIQIDQYPPMIVFLFGHVGKHPSRVGVVTPQPLGEIDVDAPVLLFAGNSEGEDFLRTLGIFFGPNSLPLLSWRGRSNSTGSHASVSKPQNAG